MTANIYEMQAAVVTWHRERFPDAQMEHVALKLCEEAGEVAKAVNGVAGRNSATGGGDVAGEAADVLICALVLLGRWFEDADLMREVGRKLSVLTDPNSGHPACVRSSKRRAAVLADEDEVPFNEDPVAIALGLVPGKSWPEDELRPGPYYWRVPDEKIDKEVIHRHGCPELANIDRKRPWFAAIGHTPEWVMQKNEGWNVAAACCFVLGREA